MYTHPITSPPPLMPSPHPPHPPTPTTPFKRALTNPTGSGNFSLYCSIICTLQLFLGYVVKIVITDVKTASSFSKITLSITYVWKKHWKVLFATRIHQSNGKRKFFKHVVQCRTRVVTRGSSPFTPFTPSPPTPTPPLTGSIQSSSSQQCAYVMSIML